MSLPFRRLRMSAAVTVLGAMLLAGCGGGSAEMVSPPAPVPGPSRSADVGQLASVVSRCGETSFEAFVATSININNGSFTAIFGGHSQVVGYMASSDYSDTSERRDVAVPQTDFRAGSLELDHPTHRMGVAVNGPFLVGSLACVKGTARAAEVDGRTEVNWFSDALAQLPVELLPGVPVAGLEFFGNFEPGNPTIHFTLGAGVVSPTTSMNLCRWNGPDGWACVPVNSTFDGSSHTYASPVPGYGVYILTEVPPSGA